MNSLHGSGLQVEGLEKQKVSSQPQAKAQSLGALHDLLTQVAPQKTGRPKEIMIAISNYNLWPLGALPLWVKVISLHLRQW